MPAGNPLTAPVNSQPNCKEVGKCSQKTMCPRGKLNGLESIISPPQTRACALDTQICTFPELRCHFRRKNPKISQITSLNLNPEKSPNSLFSMEMTRLLSFVSFCHQGEMGTKDRSSFSWKGKELHHESYVIAGICARSIIMWAIYCWLLGRKKATD